MNGTASFIVLLSLPEHFRQHASFTFFFLYGSTFILHQRAIWHWCGTYRLGAARITNLPSVVYIFVPLEGFNHQINVNIKDNLSYTFEMFVSSIEGKTLSRPTWPCVGKQLPLKLTLGCKNCHQALAVSLSHLCGEALPHFDPSSATLEHCPCQSISIRFRPDFVRCFFEPVRGALDAVCWVIFLLRNPSALVGS